MSAPASKCVGSGKTGQGPFIIVLRQRKRLGLITVLVPNGATSTGLDFTLGLPSNGSSSLNYAGRGAETLASDDAAIIVLLLRSFGVIVVEITTDRKT